MLVLLVVFESSSSSFWRWDGDNGDTADGDVDEDGDEDAGEDDEGGGSER